MSRELKISGTRLGRFGLDWRSKMLFSDNYTAGGSYPCVLAFERHGLLQAYCFGQERMRKQQ